MGISKKDQEVVFEKFGQAKASLRKEQDGTGLGLAIVKAIVERLR
jgi:signal transduction histidine kinase